MMYGLFGFTCFSFCFPIVKILFENNPLISPYEILYWKSITMMIMNYLCVRSFGAFIMDVPKKYRYVIVFRALIGYTGIQG